MVLVNADFYREKISTKTIGSFGTRLLRIFTTSLLGRKRLKNICLKGRQISVMLGAPKRLGAGPGCRRSVLNAVFSTNISYYGA